MSKTVINKTERTLSIPDIGVVAPQGTVKVPDDFNNPNFEEVTKSSGSESAPKKNASSKGGKSTSK